MSKIIEKFRTNAISTPEKLAIWCDNDAITYSELFSLMNRWSYLMTSNDVKYGDHVGVLLPNNIEFVALLLVAANTGVALVPLNPSLPVSAIARAFKSSDTQHIVGTVGSLEKLYPEEVPFIAGFWLCMDGELSHAHSFQKCIQDVPNNPLTKAKISGEEAYILTMTSGSTGDPKPIILTQQNKYDRAFAAIDLYSITASDNILAATPLYHSLAERLVLLSLLAGGTSILLPRFSPSEWLNCVKKKSVSFTIAVSSQLSQIAEHLTDKSSEINTLRCIVSSSALLEPHIKSELLAKLHCDFHECYGTSEIAIASNLSITDADVKLKSVGKAIPQVDIKILRENCTIAPSGEAGEIVCKTPMLFAGYYKLPERTQESMFDDYFRTGDTGFLDEEGFLYFLGRKKEIIITGGINVYPSDIETVILQITSIKECAAFPVFDGRLGEIIAVALVLNDDVIFDKRAIRFHCASYLADYQQPRRYFVVDKLPRNSMGKLMRYVLIKRFSENKSKERIV